MVSILGLVAVIDARARTDAGSAVRARTAAIARATGLSELALSTSSTWLRHPALAAPSSGAADATVGLDVDPAGAAIARQGRGPTIDMHREAP